MEKFRTAAQSFQTENFISVIEAVHRASWSKDNSLRMELTTLAIERLDILLLDDRVNLALEEQKSAVHAFMTDTLRAAGRKIQDLIELHQRMLKFSTDLFEGNHYTSSSRHLRGPAYRPNVYADISLSSHRNKVLF